MAPRRGNGQAVAAELSLVHLKSCLVNLPSSLESLLVYTNTVGLFIVMLLLDLLLTVFAAGAECRRRA